MKRKVIITTLALVLGCFLATASQAQVIQHRGKDSQVDYKALEKKGPWDDRNYQLTKADLALLHADEDEWGVQIPLFFRVEMRKALPEMGRYPRSALQVYRQLYGGYLIEGKIYTRVQSEAGQLKVLMQNGIAEEDWDAYQKALDGEVRLTSPNGAAESAVKIHPSNTDLVVAGTNGPGSGQKMHYSNDGGDTWQPAAALPQGNTCCDPTVDWSSDGAFAYTATLGGCGANACNIWFYRSDDNGQTWNGLTNVTAGDPRRELTSSGASDKEFIHVDKYASSPHKDNIYITWHDNNNMKFARSTNFGNTWSANLQVSSGSEQGIGSDIATDKNGHVYYVWPAFNSQKILLKKSTNGGAGFGSTIEIADTNASFDFPIPAMESRRVFVYASVDADLTSGSFGGSLYAAWTDATASTGNNASNNHAAIKVAYSRDGGNNWTITSPHETGDVNQVDRFNPWLAVGTDGKVHVIYYDTRRSANRQSVDLFYSVSSDGAQTFSTPTRVTAQQSPNIGDNFEWGDYNGLDVVLDGLIAVFTDNRNEGGGGGDSVDVYAAGIPQGGGGGNNAPSVNISAPTNGTSVQQGSNVTFTGSANDAEDGNLTASLAWSSNLDGNLGSGGSVQSSSLSVGTHTVTASVSDSNGATGSASITLTVTQAGGNQPPTVNITAPANGSSVVEGTSVAFTGNANDAEDGDLSASLTWSSNLDGGLGTGASVQSAGLSVGTHTINATVADLSGANGSASITLTVTSDGGCTPSGGLSENFEGGLNGWNTGALWHLASNSSCATPGSVSAPNALYYGQDAGCDYNTGSRTRGNLTSPVVSGLTAESTLSFDFYRQVESFAGSAYDRTLVQVRPTSGGSWTTVWRRDSRNASLATWTPSGDISLANWAGQDIKVRFRFDSVDGAANNFTGWLIDNVVVVGEACSGGGGGGTSGSGQWPNQSATVDQQLTFDFEVPAGASNLQVKITGGTGDADLYVRQGTAPTLNTFDCRPFEFGNEETCTFATPATGTWHIMVHAYEAFSGVDLTYSHD